jgi:hypothetical protein
MKKITYEEHFALGQTQWSSYGKFVNIKDLRGNTHKCCCIDEDAANLISSLPKRKSSADWSRYSATLPRPFVCRGSLTVYETEQGFLVSRCRRPNGQWSELMLAHQLTDTPVVFPSLEFGKAAAELCFPKPNRKLGYLWWNYPRQAWHSW